jgi:hypothetical protein
VLITRHDWPQWAAAKGLAGVVAKADKLRKGGTA